MTTKPITIIGGGLSGLTLGIGLRRLDVPVTVWEAGHYPRHRVCGEFISGRGQETLARLGLRDVLESAGAVRASTARFFWKNVSTPARRLPEGALCLSRFTMDAALAHEFRRLGGTLMEGKPWPGAETDAGVARATGRRLQTEEHGSRWFGLKIHARNVALTADLEMHVAAQGYVGLCRVDRGAVNVCGLFRRRAGDDNRQHGRDLLRGEPGSVLNERLADAEFDDDSFCAVAGLGLLPKRARLRTGICVGDAVTMIPPVTGNGMSMAFESAEMAVEPLVRWSRGEVAWSETQQTIARRCDTAFAGRLRWARFLQWLMFAPMLRSTTGTAVMRSEWFWRMMFLRTR